MVASSCSNLSLNAPSFSGRGKEYPRCSPKKRPAAKRTEGDLWRKVRSAWGHLGIEMVEFGFHKFGEHIQEAWKDFHLGAEHSPYDAESPENSIFIPYFLYRWKDQADRAASYGRTPAGGTIARAFLAVNRRLLPPMVAEIAKIALHQPFSFYEIVTSEPGKGMRVQDIFTGEEFDVREKSTSTCVRHGDILYGQITPMRDITTMAFSSPLVIPPRMKPEIIACRRMFRTLLGRNLSVEDLLEVEEGIRASYLRIRKELEKPGAHHQSMGHEVDLVERKKAPSHRMPNSSALEMLSRNPKNGNPGRAREVMQKEVDAWIHKKLPALWDRTPLQTMKDADGREAVAALILDYERKTEANFPESIRPDFSALWQMLQPAKKKRATGAGGIRNAKTAQTRLSPSTP